MQIGIDRFAAAISAPATGATLSPVERMHDLLEEIEVADRVGLDVFGIGEHHRAEFLDSAPVVILSAAAARTKNIRLTSAVTVLSASDPVRVFQEFATLDLISRGRAEIVAGRRPLFLVFPPFWARPGRLRSPVCGENGPAPEKPGGTDGDMVRQQTPGPDRPTNHPR